MHADSSAARLGWPKLALGDGPSFRSVALLFRGRGHLKEGAQKSNEGAQELKGAHKHQRGTQRHGMSL